MPETIDQMIVHHPHRLHEGVANRTADKHEASPLQMIVKDRFGNVLTGVPVTFTLPAKGAGGNFFTSSEAVILTDATGTATAPTLSASTMAGRFTVTATVAGISTPVVFQETNTPDTAASVTVTAGAKQTAKASTAFATPFQVIVKDKYGNAVGSGVFVTFTAPATGASGSFSVKGSPTQVTVTTTAAGAATAPTFVANHTTGTYQVTVTVPGVQTGTSLQETNA
jgi:hypothetical protein